MINYHSLHYFYVCAEQLSFSKAAALLGVSQPNLSMQIKSLEEQIGFELFFRNGKNINLTSRGQSLYSTSQQFFDFDDEINKQISKEAHANSDWMRIGVTEQVERPFVAEVVSNVIKRKKIKSSIISAPNVSLLEKAKKAELEFLISHEKLDLRWSSVKITYPVFFATSKKVQAPTFDKLTDVNRLLSYFGEDMIVPTRDLKLGHEFEKFRKANAIKAEVILESNIISCLVRSIADGLGCGFLPLPFTKSSFFEKHINLYGPKDGFWDHSIYVYGNFPNADLLANPLVKKLNSYRMEGPRLKEMVN